MLDRFLSRGKRCDNGEWAVGYLSQRKPLGSLSNITIYGICDELGTFCAVNPATIGQCTGLTAVKSYRGESEADRLIFEGDWVLVNHEITPRARVYRDGLQLGDSGGRAPRKSFDDYKILEIIGTIHDGTEGEAYD